MEKGIFPFVSKQESTINAGESFFQVCVMQHIFVLWDFSLVYKEIAAIFNVMNTGLLKVFFDVINRSDGLMDLIYELRIVSIVFSALAIVFLSLVLFDFVIANYAQVARLCSIMKAILCKFFIHLYTYFNLGLYLPACVNPMRQKKLEEGKMSRTWPTRLCL